MKALGNSKRRYLTSAERQAAQKEAEKYFNLHIGNAKKRAELMDMLVLMKTLEDDCGADENTRRLFLEKYLHRKNNLNDFLNSNTFTTGLSDHWEYDSDYNIAKIQEMCEYYGLPFEEEIFQNTL